MDSKTLKVKAELEKLPPRCRKVFILVYYHQYLPSEVAGQLGISVLAVKLYYKRSLERLLEVING